MDVLLLQVYHWFNNPLGDTSFEAFFDAVSRIGDVRNGIPVQKLKSKAYKSAYKEQSDIAGAVLKRLSEPKPTISKP